MQDITPRKLRHLRRFKALQDLNLGCHHRLIACTVTDKCLAELVVLTRLHTLNLSQCVHVGDGGACAVWAVCCLCRGARSKGAAHLAGRAAHAELWLQRSTCGFTLPALTHAQAHPPTPTRALLQA